MIVETSALGVLGIGFVLGLRHATDADHIAAVSTLVTQERSVIRSCLLGTFWGAGHTAALLVAGVLAVAFKLTISPELEHMLERGVAMMLVLLGGHVLLRTLGGALLRRHAHQHGDETHAHIHLHASDDPVDHHHHVWRFGGRPFAVGVVHGLAGSAALTLLVLSTIASPVVATLYIVVFGVGATLGMLVLSSVLAVPMVMVASRAVVLGRSLMMLAAAASIALGVGLLASGPPT